MLGTGWGAAGLCIGTQAECVAANGDVASDLVLRLALRMSNRSGREIADARLLFFLPLARTATQRLESIAASMEHRVLDVDHGHRVLETGFARLPPHALRTVSVQVVLSRAGAPEPSTAGSERLWTEPAPWLEADDPKILALARRLRRGTSPDTAEAIHRWVVENIGYTGYRPDPAGAAATLRAGSGDCTDMACLVVALARASGIPARQVGGYVAATNAVLRAGDYHDWAELHLDGTWRVSDPQLNRFRQAEPDYIAFRLNGIVLPAPIGLTRRFVGPSDMQLSW